MASLKILKLERKGFISRLNKKVKERLKVILSLLVRWVFSRKSYPFFGIPKGLSFKPEREVIFFPEEKVTLPEPQSIDKKPFWTFQKESFYAKGSIVTINRGTATSLGGVLTQEGLLTTASTSYFEAETIPQLKKELFHFSVKKFFPRILKFDGEMVSMTHGWHFNFYHWMHDILPRFGLINKSAKIFIQNDKSFQKESLALLGIDPEKIVSTKDYDAVKASSLIVPLSPRFTPKWGCEYLRNAFLPKLQKEAKKRRLYVSRNDSSKRRVSNEDEIFHLLLKYGFEKVTLSSLSLKQQMELFYNAEIVIGPHGAGFSHLVFCDKKTKFLEFFAPQYYNTSYWILANAVSLSYFYLLGKGERLPEGAPVASDPDIEIDIRELEATLKLMKC